MTILRTQREGVWEIRTNTWGQFLAPTVDPLADTVITQEQLEGFELKTDTPKIPSDLWSRWVDLCIEMTKRGTGDLEVSCRLVRSIENPSHYRIFIPVQKVTGVSVRVESFDKAVDIETGELVEQWPPEGWRPCGSSHSHNTMGAFFSGTDDKYELGDPGLHIVVGNIDVDTGTYDLCASITANMRRFLIQPSDVVDYSTASSSTYAPNCLDVISITPSFSALTAHVPLTTHYPSFTSYQDTHTDKTKATSVVSNQIQDVRLAIDELCRQGRLLNIDLSNVLNELALDLDDAAYFNQPAHSVFDDDTDLPIHWNNDLI